MIHYIAPVGSEHLIQDNISKWIQKHFPKALMSISASACTTPSMTSLMYRDRFSKGTRRVQEHGGLLKVKGLVLLCPQVLRKSFPSYLKQAEPGQMRAWIDWIRHACLDWAEKTFSTFVPKGPVEKPRGHKQSPVGIGQNKSLVCAGLIQKQKPSAWILQQSLKKKKRKSGLLPAATLNNISTQKHPKNYLICIQ